MRIDGTTSSSDTTGTSGLTTSQTGLAPTRDEFLRLFVAQLQHQDPLDPADPSEMVAQLAQLTSVEQTAGLTSRLDALVAQQASTGRAALLGLVGRHVEAAADHITVRDGAEPPPVVADLDRGASNVTVVIRDAAGIEVRRLELGPQPAGPVNLLATAGLPPGTYQLEIDAVDAGGKAMTVSPVIRGTVDSVAFGSDGAHLYIGNSTVDPADIASVS